MNTVDIIISIRRCSPSTPVVNLLNLRFHPVRRRRPCHQPQLRICTMQAFLPAAPTSPTNRSSPAFTPRSPLRHTKSRQLCLRRRCAAVPKCSANPDPSASVAYKVAAAFVEACRPGETPYAIALRNFCLTALEAYRSGYSLQALQFELSASGETGLSGQGQPTRSLQSDEVELRSVWLTLVYKTLRQLAFPVRRDDAAASEMPRTVFSDSYDKLDEFVGNIITAVKAGYDMKRIQLEQSLSQANADRPRTSIESAILGQSTRLVVTTISAASDALKEGQSEDDDK